MHVLFCFFKYICHFSGLLLRGKKRHICRVHCLNQKHIKEFYYGLKSTHNKELGFPGGISGKRTQQCRRHKRHEFSPWVRKIPWRSTQQVTSVFLPEESPWTETPSWLESIGLTHRELEMTEATKHMHSLSVVLHIYKYLFSYQ